MTDTDNTQSGPIPAGVAGGLSNDMIAKLMGESRTRNAYGPKLKDFVDSSEAAINPRDAWPIDFKQKQTATLYQGFLNAVKKGKLDDVIMVKQSNDEVFLLHKERVQLVLAEQVASENGNGNGEHADADADTEAE